MISLRKSIQTCLCAVFIAVTATAHAATPAVDRRQARQEARIEQGVASGELTARETRRLQAGQNHVQRVEDRVEADGVVTTRERARLHREQNQASRRIYRNKHDRAHR